MKLSALFIIVSITVFSCSTRKAETSASTDSLTVPSDSSELALTPATSALASDPLEGYVVKNAMILTDSVNYILLTTQEEFDKNFGADKGSQNIGTPDFVINYIVGIACKPSPLATTLTIDKVEATNQEIGVYILISRGEKQSASIKASRVFSIEKRDGIGTMQFYVNGKKDKSFFLTGM